MTSNRLKKLPAYRLGSYAASGLPPTPEQLAQYTTSTIGREAYDAGFNDCRAEIEREDEKYRLAHEDLSILLREARDERDFDKLCAVVERLIDG
jgi:hypothetical protein